MWSHNLVGFGISGPAAHYRMADRALPDAAPLSNQLSEAILLHAQSNARGDIALEGQIGCVQRDGHQDLGDGGFDASIGGDRHFP